MADDNAKRGARLKNDALVTWRIESFPISVSQNKLYTDRLVGILDRRIRRNPTIYSLYSRGRLVEIGSSDQGIQRLRGVVQANKKKARFDRFAVYTLAKRRHANDIEALARRIAFPQDGSAKNFAKARNLGEVVRRDVRQWSTAETRRINRALRPMERKYAKSVRRLEKQEARLRKSYSKRIEKARDAMRQKKLRTERDKRINSLKVQRRRLQPLRNNILQRQAELRTFQNLEI